MNCQSILSIPSYINTRYVLVPTNNQKPVFGLGRYRDTEMMMMEEGEEAWKQALLFLQPMIRRANGKTPMIMGGEFQCTFHLGGQDTTKDMPCNGQGYSGMDCF